MRIALLVIVLFAFSPIATFAQDQDSFFMIRAADVMKQMQDAVCNQPTDELIQAQVDYAVELNVTHMAISTPYDDPDCGSSMDLTWRYVTAIREAGLCVWFRQKPLAFEGFYDTPRSTDPDEMSLVIVKYLLENADLFEDCDIFTPAPEPENGGVRGLTHCNNDICLFDSIDEFNQWVVDITNISNSFFELINVDVTVGMFGNNGFVVWGDRNPDWTGSLSQEAVSAMNNIIAIDHYFPIDADINAEFENITNSIRSRYGEDVQICLSEWGSIHGESPERVREVLQAALDHGITCINWWHLGPGGIGEQLIDYQNGQLLPTEMFSVVQEFYSR